MNGAWEKEFHSQVSKATESMNPLTWEQIRVITGIVAEHRQIADRDGFIRGYNDGYAQCQNKLAKLLETD